MIDQTDVMSVVNSKTALKGKTGCSELMDFDPDDGGNADSFVWLFGNRFLYVDELGWLFYNEKYWERDTAELGVAIEQVLLARQHEAVDCKRDNINSARKRNKFRIDGVTSLLEKRLHASIEDFDNNPDVLNVANGVFDLRTMTLTPHDPAQRFTYVVDVEYDPDADSSEWETFLSDAVIPEAETGLDVEELEQEHTGLLDFIQQAAGYSFTGHTREEKLLYVYGPTRSGKGTFTEALLALLPHPIGIEVDFNTFTARRDGNDQNFDLADMKASRFVVASESNKYQTLNPAKIKQMTGGNYIQAAFKRKDRFSYRPQYAVWLVSNHKVLGDPDDDAMWGRVLVVNFPNSHLGNEDTTLKMRLKSPEAQRGILKWVVDGASKWYASERLVIPDRVKLATIEHRKDLDNMTPWIEERTVQVINGFTATADLTSSYLEWCKANNIEPKKNREFSQSLKRNGYEPDRKYATIVREKKGDIMVTRYDFSNGGTTRVRGHRDIGLIPM